MGGAAALFGAGKAITKGIAGSGPDAGAIAAENQRKLDEESSRIAGEEESARKEESEGAEQERLDRGSRSSTILTSPGGLLDEEDDSTISRKTLVGF